MPPSISITPNTIIGREYTTLNPSGSTKSALTSRIVKTMYSGMSGNYGYPHYPPNRDIGGSFLLIGAETDFDIQDAGELWRGGATDQRYVGSLVFSSRRPSSVPASPPDSRAAEAYSKMKPTKPLFSALNSYYELRELPDLIWLLKGRIKDIRDLGKFHLTGVFGILPVLSDVKTIIGLQQKTEKRLNQLLRDNGRPVRRKIILSDVTSDPTVEVVATGSSGVAPGLVTQYYNQLPVCTYTARNHERWWASAQFRYWLPPGPQDAAYKATLMRYLHGVTVPTASQLYNAIPWSWLIDWFTNVGDVVDNLTFSLGERLAADWFYIMRENTNSVVTDTTVVFKRRSGELAPFRGSSVSRDFYKSRVRGDPFGLHTKESELSGMQLSILGALGLSRL